MNREVLDKFCERAILALVLAILIFGPLALGAVRGLEFAIIQGLTLGVMVLWALRLWVAPKPQLLWPPICWAVLAFTLYAIVRYLTADVEYIARHELLRVLVYAILFLAVLNNLHRQEATSLIVAVMVFLALAISGYAIYQFLKDAKYVYHFVKLYPHRGSGTYICPNHLGGFLELVLPLALAYTVAGRLRHLTRILAGYAALVILGGIAVTLSRGAWVSTAFALVLFCGALLFRRPYRLPALALIAVLMGAGILATAKSHNIDERLQQLVRPPGQPAEDMRVALWVPAWQMWRDHPLWGVGPAHYDTRFRGYRPESVQLTPERAHNDYLNTLADWGLVGTVLVASAWVLLAFGVAQTWRSRRLAPSDLGSKMTSNKYAFLLGASLGLVAILAHSVVDFNMHVPANAILVVTLMALLSAHLRFATERFWFRSRLWSTLAVSLVAVLAVVYMAPQARRQAAEFTWLDRAQKAPSFSTNQLALLERAFAVEPKNPETAYIIGTVLRRWSQQGWDRDTGLAGADYQKLAAEAMEWYQRGMDLNCWDGRNHAQYGWCLDWLDRSAEATPYFHRAEELDPNNYYNLNQIGMHWVSLGNYAAAQPWFERSLKLEYGGNEIATAYLKIVEIRLLEAATNVLSPQLLFGPK